MNSFVSWPAFWLSGPLSVVVQGGCEYGSKPAGPNSALIDASIDRRKIIEINIPTDAWSSIVLPLRLSKRL